MDEGVAHGAPPLPNGCWGRRSQVFFWMVTAIMLPMLWWMKPYSCTCRHHKIDSIIHVWALHSLYAQLWHDRVDDLEKYEEEQVPWEDPEWWEVLQALWKTKNMTKECMKVQSHGQSVRSHSSCHYCQRLLTWSCQWWELLKASMCDHGVGARSKRNWRQIVSYGVY